MSLSEVYFILSWICRYAVGKLIGIKWEKD